MRPVLPEERPRAKFEFGMSLVSQLRRPSAHTNKQEKTPVAAYSTVILALLRPRAICVCNFNAYCVFRQRHGDAARTRAVRIKINLSVSYGLLFIEKHTEETDQIQSHVHARRLREHRYIDRQNISDSNKYIPCSRS